MSVFMAAWSLIGGWVRHRVCACGYAGGLLALGARVHLLEHGARSVDVAEHLELPRLAPLGLGHAEDISARDGAGVVHQDIGMATRLDDGKRGVALGADGWMEIDGSVVDGADLD